jgi:hypothetical protein
MYATSPCLLVYLSTCTLMASYVALTMVPQ